MDSKFGFGIRGRLWGAFAAIATLLGICGLVSFIAFAKFGDAVETIVEHRLPRIEASLKLVLEGERIAATGATLAQSANTEMRRQANAALERSIRQAGDLVAILRAGDGAGGKSDQVVSGIEKLAGILREADKLVGEALERQLRLAEAGATATRLGEEFAAALQPLASEQRNGLVGQIAVLGSAASSPDRKLAAENGIRQVADAMRALGRMGAASATLQSAITRLQSIDEEAALSRLGQTVKREIDTLVSAADDLDQKTAQAIEPFVERWERLVKADPVSFQRRQIEAQQARVRLAASGLAAASDLARAIEEGVSASKTDVADAASNARSLVGASEITIAFVISVGIAISILIGWFYVGRNVAGRLLSLASAMRRLADGDLRIEVPPSGRDEIGAMVDAMQVFKSNAERMRGMEAEQEEAANRAAKEKREAALKLADDFEHKMAGIVDRVSRFAAETTAFAETLVANARNSADLSRSVSERIDSSLGNAQTVASASEELATSITEISRQVSQSTAISGRAVKVAGSANQVVEGLVGNAQQIGDVAKMIQEIANQTNLLALNATIEAARAGEAGKGFAVVASEVKGLATQTARATDQITTQIAEVQDATRQVVEAIRGIGSTISEIDGVSGAIASAVEQQGATTREIAGSIQRVATGTRDAAADTAEAQKAAIETGEAASKVLAAAKELNQTSAELRRQIDGFLGSVRAA